ncbi:hypothetical protein L3Q82_005079 [Scortum barcoo]|uniref:Uncharacterized protein n=1 Tax=Scortum barcoo TaxID=214431 RepID=A0ACB8VEJ4_9TELE|nr:hypothetical protein L3Q82_005079 [Scortum barcoo]
MEAVKIWDGETFSQGGWWPCAEFTHSLKYERKKKWQHVADAASEGRTVAKVKKKWSDIKVDAKKRLASRRQSVCATRRGRGTPKLTPLDEKLAGIIGESLLSGVVTEVEGDTDAHDAPNDSVVGDTICLLDPQTTEDIPNPCFDGPSTSRAFDEDTVSVDKEIPEVATGTQIPAGKSEFYKKGKKDKWILKEDH